MSDILEKVSDPETIALIHEYINLAKLSELNEYQSMRHDQILLLAEQNEEVDFLINEIEYILGYESRLLDMKMVGDSQALLREHLGSDISKLMGVCSNDINCPTLIS